MNKIEKGYTITVTSWENDGDNYNTKSITVDSIEKAKAYYDLMQLCKSKNNTKEIRLGNTSEFSTKQKKLIVSFLINNPILLEGDEENASEDDLIDIFYDIIYELLGGSEFYACRVMESCVVTYSDIEVITEIIKF